MEKNKQTNKKELPALIEIHQRLVTTGLSEEKADELLAKFLEEEAFDYVRSMSKYYSLQELEDNGKKNKMYN